MRRDDEDDEDGDRSERTPTRRGPRSQWSPANPALLAVVGLTVALAVVVGFVAFASYAPRREATEVAPDAIQSGAGMRGRAVGEVVTVRGKIGIGSDGGLGSADVPARPVFSLTFPDGEGVTCAFADTPRAEYENWLRRNRPGTLVTVRGTYVGGRGQSHTLAGCEVLPGGFR